MSGTLCWICGHLHEAGGTCSQGPDARLGTLLDDKYKIVREVGAGGTGKVYEAQHVRIGRRVAIKFLLPESARDAEIMRRFENEARAAGSLEHENIAAVHDFGRSSDGACFLVMDFLVGEDCEELRSRQVTLPLARAVNIVLQTCCGLDAAHRSHIVHRDLKPANLYLTRRADRIELVKILDFGSAKLKRDGDEGQTATGQAMARPYYVSPEQARGDKTVDHRTDIYALGVILYELLSGRRPHEGGSYLEIRYSILNQRPKSLAELRPDLPKNLVRVVEKAMSYEAAERYATVADLGEALIPFAPGSVAPFHSPPSAPPAAAAGDHTLAASTDVADDPAGTMAPLTPKTLSGVPLSSRATKVKWAIASLALGVIASLTWLRLTAPIRANPAAVVAKSGADALGSATAESSSPSASAPPAVASAVTTVSGQPRPDSGVAVAPPAAPAPVRHAIENNRALNL